MQGRFLQDFTYANLKKSNEADMLFSYRP